MKKKEDKNKDELYTDESLEKIFQEGIEWFQPKWVDVKDSDGKVVGQKDEHIRHLFVNEFLMTKGLYKQRLNLIFNTRPWVKKIYNQLAEVQEYKLANMGAFREIDSSITKFVLSNKHDWKEKTENKDTLEFKDFDLKNLVSFKTQPDEKPKKGRKKKK
jgi:hypothetical protein